MGSRHPPKLVLFLKSKFSYQLGGCCEPIQKGHNQLVFLILRGTIHRFYINMLDGVIFGNFGYVNSPWKFPNFTHSSRSTDALNKSVPHVFSKISVKRMNMPPKNFLPFQTFMILIKYVLSLLR